MEQYKLEYPIDGIDKELIESVKVRRMNAGDIMSLKENDSEGVQTGKMLSRLCGLDISEIERLDVVDFQALQEIVGKQRASQRAGKRTKKS